MKYGKQIPELSGKDIERFWGHVERGEDCWEWAGPSGRGYGRFAIDGRHYAAHRVAWLIEHGRQPESEVLDHLCSNPACVRPDHLDDVTQSENCRRGENGYGSRSLCRAGLHEIIDPDNVIEGSNGRQCRECVRESQRRYDARRREDPVFRARKAQYLRERRRKAGPWEPVGGENFV